MFFRRGCVASQTDRFICGRLRALCGVLRRRTAERVGLCRRTVVRSGLPRRTLVRSGLPGRAVVRSGLRSRAPEGGCGRLRSLCGGRGSVRALDRNGASFCGRRFRPRSCILYGRRLLARGRQHAGPVAFGADGGFGGDRLRRGLHAFLLQAFAKALRVQLAARLRLLLGQLAVVFQLDRRGIAELLGRRVGEELVVHAALGGTHGSLHVLLELGGKLAADIELHGQQHDADDRKDPGDQQSDDYGVSQHAGIFVRQLRKVRVGGIDVDGIVFAVDERFEIGQVQPDRIGAACVPRGIDRIDAEAKLPHAVQLIGDGIIGFALPQFAVARDLAEHRFLEQNGVVQPHVAVIADLELDRGAKLAVFVVIRVLQHGVQHEANRVGRDERQHGVLVFVLDGELHVQSVDGGQVEAHGADPVGGKRGRDGIQDHLGLSGRKVERLLDRRVDLVVKLDLRDRSVAVVCDRHGERRALLRRRVRLSKDRKIDQDGLDGDGRFGVGRHLPAAGDVFDPRREDHVFLAHFVFDGHAIRLPRRDFVRGQRDRLHAPFRIVKLKPGHVVLGVVSDHVFDGERIARANARRIDAGRNRQLGDHEPFDLHRRRRFPLMADKRCVAGFLVDHSLDILPRKRIGHFRAELLLADGDVIQVKFARTAGRDGDRFLEIAFAVLVASGKNGVGQRVVRFRLVANGEQKIGDRSRRLELGHGIAGDRQRDRMIAVGSSARRENKSREQQRRYDRIQQNPFHTVFKRSPTRPPSQKIQSILRRALRP